MSYIQLTPFDNMSDVAHSDETIKEFATVTISRDHIVAIRKPKRRSNNSLTYDGLTYTPTIITLVTCDIVKVCESYDYVLDQCRNVVNCGGDGLIPYVQGVRTDRWGNTAAEEQL